MWRRRIIHHHAVTNLRQRKALTAQVFNAVRYVCSNAVARHRNDRILIYQQMQRWLTGAEMVTLPECYCVGR